MQMQSRNSKEILFVFRTDVVVFLQNWFLIKVNSLFEDFNQYIISSLSSRNNLADTLNVWPALLLILPLFVCLLHVWILTNKGFFHNLLLSNCTCLTECVLSSWCSAKQVSLLFRNTKLNLDFTKCHWTLSETCQYKRSLNVVMKMCY
jgi:hypothetical protein